MASKQATETKNIEATRCMWRRRTIWCHRIALALGMLVVTPLMWMAADNRKCVDIKPAAVSMVPNKARSGDTVEIKWMATPYRDCGGEVIGRTRDGAGVWHVSDRGETVYKDMLTLNGIEQPFSKPYVVPAGAPGEALYEPAIYRWRNFVQQYIWRPAPEHPLQIRYTMLPPKQIVIEQPQRAKKK